MDTWKDALKWGAVLVASGIVTAVAIMWLEGRIQTAASTAARAELQKTLTALMQQTQQKTPPTSEPAPTFPQLEII